MGERGRPARIRILEESKLGNASFLLLGLIDTGYFRVRTR